MEMLTLKKYFASFTLITLVFGALILSGTNSCGVSAVRSLLVGGECTAESISTQTLWILEEEQEAVLTEKIALIAVLLFGLALVRHLLPIKVDVAKRLWIRAQEVHRERNLFHKKIFLPYLFATHGL